MAKQGMARPDWTKRPRNSAPPVPEIQGKAKTTKTPARPIIAGTSGPQQKVYHSAPHSERPISPAHGIIDTDLARDNLENDIPAADLEDLEHKLPTEHRQPRSQSTTMVQAPRNHPACAIAYFMDIKNPSRAGTCMFRPWAGKSSCERGNQ